MRRAAVFVDRDGTLIVDTGYLRDPERVAWIPGAREAIARLNRAGFLVVVVTNQSGVARGYFGEADVESIHDRMSADLAREGARIDAFYYCPFHPDGEGQYRRVSRDRKPDIGMYERAVAELDIDGSRSWMIGDKPEDMLFAQRAGVRAIRVATGSAMPADAAARFEYAADVAAAVEHILATSESDPSSP